MDFDMGRAKAILVALCFLLLCSFGPPALGQVVLTQGSPVSGTASPTTFTFTTLSGFWNVVGVSSASDWDLQISSSTSVWAGNSCDFLAVDAFAGTPATSPGNDNVSLWTGSTGFTLVHANIGMTINAALTGATAQTYTWAASDILYGWEVNVGTAGTYPINVTGPTGLGWAYFQPVITAAWQNRSAAAYSGTVGTVSNCSLNAGWGFLVVYRDGGPGSTGTVSAMVGSGTTGTPNLVASAITVVSAPVTVLNDGSGTFQATRSIQNTGTAAGSTSYTIYISTDATITTADTAVYTGTTASIAAGAVDIQTVPCTVPNGTATGTYYAGLYLAASNTACTSSADVTVTAPSAANLVAQSVSAVSPPVSVVNDGTGTFQVNRSIQNTGTAAGSTSYTIYISTDATISTADTAVYTGTTSSIAAGATDTQAVTCTVPNTTATGTYYVGLYIGASNWACSAAADVTVTVPPNFVPVAQAVSVPGAVVSVVGDGSGTFQVSRSIQNTGTAAGTTPYTIYISTDSNISTADIPVYASTTPSIASGTTDTQTVTCTVPNGTATGMYYVGLYIDATNNLATVSTDVNVIPSPANLQVQSVSVPGAPVTVEIGASFDVTRSIRNDGGTAGTASYTIYLSPNNSITTSDIPVYSGSTASISPGATSTVTVSGTVPAGTPAGSYYVGVYISPMNYACTFGVVVTILVPEDSEVISAFGCGNADSGQGRGGIISLLPLLLLAGLFGFLRRRAGARRREAGSAIVRITAMKAAVTAGMLLALCGVALGEGFTDRHLPLSEVLSLLPGQEGGGWEGGGSAWGEGESGGGDDGEGWGDEGPGWGEMPEEEERPSREVPQKGAPAEPAPPGGGIKIAAMLGGVAPLAAKEESYAAGLDLALSLLIGLRAKFPSWIRPTLDVGFVSAQGENWKSSSTLLMFHFDVGYDFLRTEKARSGFFAGLGAGVELLSGEQLALAGTMESVSQTNTNVLGGAGAYLAFALSEKVDLGFDLRLTCPLGSRNVQAVLLFGVNLGIKL